MDTNESSSVTLEYVKSGYYYLINLVAYLMNRYHTIFLLPLILVTASQFSRLNLDDIINLYHLLERNLILVVALLNVAVFGFVTYIMTRARSVYLVDFSCYRPPDNLKVKSEILLKWAKQHGGFNSSSLDFLVKIQERSGLGEETYLPAVMQSNPPTPSLTAAKEEAERQLFGALDILFKNTNVNTKDIGILVVNCSLFHPIPSLSSMIVNKYKLRGSIKTINLGGMGCSAGLIAVDLAKDMLQVHRNTYAVVVSMENLVEEWYKGNKKSMLIPNCLFRIGCAAVLLSNKSSDKSRAKYKLLHVVRTHQAADDAAFNCVRREKDNDGIYGVSLSKDLMTVAGNALKANITTLAPLVLPLSEQLFFVANLVARKLLKSKTKPYTPDFKKAFDHFCIHAGGKAVIDELEKNMHLSKEHVEPSRMALYRFGNTSASSIWYELAYTEAKGRMKKGNHIWQIAFGSGFKCNSAVWVAMRAVRPSANNPWADCIHKFPVKI